MKSAAPVSSLRLLARRRLRARSLHRHSAATLALHWATVFAVLVAAGSGLAREWVEDEALRILLLRVHEQAGLFVLVALALRLLNRFVFGLANHAGKMPLLMRWAAQLAHAGMYLLLAVLPVLGWAVCSAKAMDLSLFGLVRLPALVQDDPDLADLLIDRHVFAAWTLLTMVVLHVAAALWHHRVRRDGVLMAMLPWLRRRERLQPEPEPEPEGPQTRLGADSLDYP